MEAGDQGMRRREAGVVILFAAENRRMRNRPARAWSPPPYVDETIAPAHLHGRRARRRACRVPEVAPISSAPRAGSKQMKGQREVEGSARLEPRLCIRDHAVNLRG